MEEEAKRAPLDREATTKRVYASKYGEEGEERRGEDQEATELRVALDPRGELDSKSKARLPRGFRDAIAALCS